FPRSLLPPTPPISLHDALPISRPGGVLLRAPRHARGLRRRRLGDHQERLPRPEHGVSESDRPAPAALAGPVEPPAVPPRRQGRRSEEHTSELQSRGHLVCRLLL